MTLRWYQTLVLLVGLLMAGMASGVDYVINDYAAAQQVSISPGGEFPGAVVTGERIAQGATNTPGAARMTFDFSKGGKYAVLAIAGNFPSRLAALKLQLRTSGTPPFILRVLDAKGETFQYYGKSTKAGEWQAITIDLTTMANWFSFGGDKIVDQPIAAMAIGPEADAQTVQGTFDIDEVTVVTRLTQGELTQERGMAAMKEMKLTLKTEMLGNLFYPDEHVAGLLAVQAPTADLPKEIPVTVTVFDAFDKIVATLAPVALTSTNGYAAAVELPKTLGFYRLQMDTNGLSFEGRYAVIPANPVTAKDPASPFGVNTHFNQGWDLELGKLVARVGIGWIRDGEANMDDRAIQAAKANQLCYLPCFTWYRMPQAEKHRKADGSWNFADVADWHKQYAQKYGDYVDYYDLVNEPQGAWASVFGGSWDGGAWVQPFVTTYATQITKALKAGDRNAKVLWEDCTELLLFSYFAKYDKEQLVDVISPHPYNMFTMRALPEEHLMFRQLPVYHKFVRDHKLDWQLWSGEVGFSAFTVKDPSKKPFFYDPNTELHQAQLLARMMVAQLAYGVDKIFWYDFRNDGWDELNPEHNFGLVRNDSTPKPAVVAYANIINQLKGCQWLGTYVIGGGGEAYAFRSARTGKPVLAAWLPRGYKQEAVAVPSNVKSVIATDIFGGVKIYPVEKHFVLVDLSETPLFIEGLDEQDVKQNLLPLLR